MLCLQYTYACHSRSNLCYFVLQYVLPSVVFHKTVRSTMTGFSAASGKLGAVAGAYIFGAVAGATSFPAVMILCAVLALVGIVVTHYCIDEPDDEGDSIEREEEDARMKNDSSRGLISEGY
jgi:nitrate/nitrite transporter NarK